jgi:hypothetical protein
MKPISEMTRAELAAYIQSNLNKVGIDVVLSGGSCVSIYSNEAYVSMDLDLINTQVFSLKRNLLIKSMKEMGFFQDGRHFTHPDTIYFVEFPSGPPAVGEEMIKDIVTKNLSTGVLKIISPTECIKDRLTWYYHDNDLQCLEQAILVASNNDFNIAEIKRWSKNEGMLDKFLKIKNRFDHLCKE